MRKISKKHFAFQFILHLSFIGTPVECRPCDPTDPLGHNPGNLCPQLPYSSINNNSFIEGHGLPVTTIPTTRNPAGIVIQKPSGFWTNIRTTSDQRTIVDSSGNSYILPNQNRMAR